jgi:hypothetical protein
MHRVPNMMGRWSLEDGAAERGIKGEAREDFEKET